MSYLLPCLAMMMLVSFRFSVAQIFYELVCTVYGNQDLLMYSNQDLLSQRETDLSPSLAVSGFWLFPASPNLSSGQMAQYKHTNANTQIQVRKYKYTSTSLQTNTNTQIVVLFPASSNLRPVRWTNGATQGAYLGNDSSNGNFREMVEIYTTIDPFGKVSH